MPATPLDNAVNNITPEVKIGGTDIAENYNIEKITISKAIYQISTAKIVISDGNPADNEFASVENEQWTPGQTVEIKAGYESSTNIVFKGVIVKHSVRTMGTQGSVSIIECADETVALMAYRISKVYLEMKDSAIWSEIANKYGVTVTADSTNITHKQIVQHNISGFDFIVSRAQANEMITYTDDNTFYVKTPSLSGSAELTVTYGIDLKDFDLSIDSRFQLKEVETLSWDHSSNNTVSSTQTKNDDYDESSLTGQTISDAIKADKHTLYSTGKMESSELQTWAKSQLMLSRLSKYIGFLEFQGNHLPKPNTLIEVDGIGRYYNGKVYVSGVHHEIKEGDWITRVDVGLDPELLVTKKRDAAFPISNGLFPGVHGLFIAKVKKIEADPDGEYRIQVNIPMINDEGNDVWARVSQIMASEDFGSFFLPEIDDEVVCGALGGDIRFPVVLGHLYSRSRRRPDGEFDNSDDNHEKGWKTRSGMLFHFNDDKKIVRLETPAGNKLILDEDDKSITLEDQNNNKIVMDRDGIKITTPKDFVVEANGKIEQESMSNSKYKATAGSVEVDGASGAKLTTNAICEVKGSLVKIN